MNSPPANIQPPDQRERDRALDPSRSILVQAPAGSGKTTLLAARFLTLLAEVDDPGEIVAITFTNAAAAEMRNRILDELRKDEPSPVASRALAHSEALGWKLLDLPAQLRIMTIDSFCRELALQQPLLSGLPSGLSIFELPKELYLRAARQTLEQIDNGEPGLRSAITALLRWRDNNWPEVEEQLVGMLANRDRWMHDFVLDREPDPEELRSRLERPFAIALTASLAQLSQMLDRVPHARAEALELARFACGMTEGRLHQELAEMAEFPNLAITDLDAIEEARDACRCLANMVLTKQGSFRKKVDKNDGFPPHCKAEKTRMLALIADLKNVPGLETVLAALSTMPLRYTEEEWEIVRSCFTLLRHAAGQLRVVFAETGAVDFTEVAQIALRVLEGNGGPPSDAALAVGDRIRHLLVDEFQDTSRRQHRLLAGLIAAWPEREGRTCFVVGDPMQSIYFFRGADAELFSRVRDFGLETPSYFGSPLEPLHLDPVQLSANFRTSPPLLRNLNDGFERVFAVDDGSGIRFAKAEPCRNDASRHVQNSLLHLRFVPQNKGTKQDQSGSHQSGILAEIEAARIAQTAEIVELIRTHVASMELARAQGADKYRIAVLGRTRKALAAVAEALREAGVPFRAIGLENLSDRPEVLDALSLARALLNPEDRVAWLGVLRAPWCGLTLDDLHKLSSADQDAMIARPVPELLAEGLEGLSEHGRPAAHRVLKAWTAMPALRAAQPAASLGTWLEQIWLRLGGAECVDATGRANVDLLWSCLDGLPEGEQDLLGPGLNAALENLEALPDPAASSEFGVQLMTIHKSKGLEFEVVIVPDLQAPGGNGKRDMLSWLERGLTEPGPYGEITEFLIAPFQPKGREKGQAKAWVDKVYRGREKQEMRRLLYVAATRARDELHLFARPAYKSVNGNLEMVEPKDTLLATAWPAVQEEIEAKFAGWRTASLEQGEADVVAIAAAAENNVLPFPAPTAPTLLRRLPADYRSEFQTPRDEQFDAERIDAGDAPLPVAGMATVQGYSRHEGGLVSRALGNAVHALLEEVARLRESLSWDEVRAAIPGMEGWIAAQVRGSGVDPAQAAAIAAEAMRHALNASHDSIGQWILSPHPGAGSEVSWAGVVAGGLRTVRVDRTFQAGETPLSEGADCWWIIDYKTAHAPEADLPELRRVFAPQIEAYAQMLRNLHGGTTQIRAGLYYPRMLKFDWWGY
jgi:ATP-dependent exoDNAse (exonuclease V) beta subunit